MTGEATPIRELLRDLWESRQLLRMLARKDFFVRYRRASFGLLWAATLPLFQAAVLSVVFSRVVRVETDVPYAVFIFAPYAAWGYFSSTLTPASTAIVDNAALSNKIYFPRAVLPLSLVLANLYGFAFTLLAVVLVCAGFGVNPGVRILLLGPATLMLVLLTAALSMLLSALHVYFRDTRFFLQAILSVWLFVTPVLYPIDLAPASLQPIIRVNPMSGVAEMFRAAVTGEERGWASSVYATLAWTAGALAVALLMHRRYNRVFSDLL